MGHNNPRQKIQYHLRLKQELEEMRHECMLLLRERFHLEQCVRYLAVRSQFPVAGRGRSAAQGGADSRSPLEKNPVQPASLRRHHLYATPVSRRSLMLAGRGKQALQEGQAWQSKVIYCVCCLSFICFHLLRHSSMRFLLHSCPHISLIRSLTHSLIHSLTHSSLTHSLVIYLAVSNLHCCMIRGDFANTLRILILHVPCSTQAPHPQTSRSKCSWCVHTKQPNVCGAN